MAEQIHQNIANEIKSSFAQDLVDRLLTSLKQTQSPLSTSTPLPFNPVTEERFYGANLLSLMLTPYQDPRWYSFDAVREMKGDISGQKGTPCLFWSPKWETVTRTKLDANGQPVLDNNGHRIETTYRKCKLTLKRFVVFNAEQISGVDLPPLSKLETKPSNTLDSIIKACPIVFEQGNDDIYFTATDKLTLQNPKDPNYFEKAIELLARWSGHTERLNREIGGLFGGANDAKEELRAKLALMILATEEGVSVDPFLQINQTYFKQWEALLTKNPCEILRITKDAEAIAKFLYSMRATLAQANLGSNIPEDVETMYKNLNLKNWSGKVLVRPEFIRDETCEVVLDPKKANQFSVYLIDKNGSLEFVGKGKTATEANAFAEKLKALHESEQVSNQEEKKTQGPKQSKSPNENTQNSGKRFWLGNIYDKDRQKFTKKITKIKQNGGKYDAKYKRWYLPEGVNPEPLKEFWPKKKLTQRQETNAMDAHNELKEALIDMGFKVGTDDPIMDGQIHRCPLKDDKPGQLGGSYIAYLNEGHGWPYARIENFRTGEIRKWKANGTGHFVSDAQKEQLKAQAEKAKEERLQALQSQYETVAKECQQAYQQSTLAKEPSAYLQRKGIGQSEFDQLHQVKLDERGNLMIPLQDTEGKIWSVEKIHPNGFKSLAKGGQKSGHFSVIETAAQQSLGLDNANVILICEGYATGVSLALTLKQPVVMAVDAGNLPSVAKALKDKYPNKAFVICGDDDRDNKVNKGREKALEAAEAIGAEVVFPTFAEDERGKDFTDFNDLATKSRLGKVGLEQQVSPIVNRLLSAQQRHTSEHKQTSVKKL